MRSGDRGTLSSGYLCELPGLPGELGERLGELRGLRAQLQSSIQESSALKQLEQKLGVVSLRTPSFSALTASPQKENFYRRQLLHGRTRPPPPSGHTAAHRVPVCRVCRVQARYLCSADPAPSPPVRDIGLFNCGSPGLLYSDLDDSRSTANGVTLTPLHVLIRGLILTDVCVLRRMENDLGPYGRNKTIGGQVKGSNSTDVSMELIWVYYLFLQKNSSRTVFPSFVRFRFPDGFGQCTSAFIRVAGGRQLIKDACHWDL